MVSLSLEDLLVTRKFRGRPIKETGALGSLGLLKWPMGREIYRKGEWQVMNVVS